MNIESLLMGAAWSSIAFWIYWVFRRHRSTPKAPIEIQVEPVYESRLLCEGQLVWGWGGRIITGAGAFVRSTDKGPEYHFAESGRSYLVEIRRKEN